jgi:ABC-type sugar transport system ATPase subunit
VPAPPKSFAALETHDRQEAMTLADRIAFLSDGQLQQYAAAPELYERPATTAVARFFGMANLFPATVADGISATALGPLQIAHTDRPGAQSVIGIRPEHIRLCGGTNAVTGRVTALTSLGLHQQATLQTRAGVDLTLLLPTDPPRSVADDITVSLPPERLRLIADPSVEYARDGLA